MENLHVAAQRQGFAAQARAWDSADERERAMEVLDFVGLTRLAPEIAGGLSYGQQKLLEFAFITMAKAVGNPARRARPEASTPACCSASADRIRALNSEGVTFIIVEHDMEFVMRLCDQVLVMHQGSALTSGPPGQVRSDPAVLEAYLGTGPKEGS